MIIVSHSNIAHTPNPFSNISAWYSEFAIRHFFFFLNISIHGLVRWLPPKLQLIGQIV